VSSGREWRKKKNDENLWSLDLETGAWTWTGWTAGPREWRKKENEEKKGLKL
jgi:hypothetical protein